ncbi:MAG TPA: YIP1 family protein, partial [Thermoanaerobaculia bacterium]|nr:YIP1 family protein [Thermoanaerobaculia bacterium]
FGRLIGALVAPGRTFESIREKPSWVVPLVLLVLLSVGVGLALQDRADPSAIARVTMERLGMEPTPEQLEEMERQSENQPAAMKSVGLVFGALANAAFYVVLAAVFLVIFRLCGSEISFLQSLAATVHGVLPLALAALLNIPLVLSRSEVRAEEVLAGGVLVSSPRLLAPEDSPVVASLLGSLDFFVIWTLVLLIIGFRHVARVSTATAAAAVLVPWGLWVLGKAGFVAIVN